MKHTTDAFKASNFHLSYFSTIGKDMPYMYIFKLSEEVT
jgi:hypothetical protein